jgi:biopolymer transport protein ExbB
VNGVIGELWISLTTLTGVRDFLELGGPVLLMVLLVGFFLWLLLIERLLYFLFWLPSAVRQRQQVWQARSEQHSWFARQQGQALLAELDLLSRRGLLMIRTLIGLAPLFGLLGTVTGMLSLFEAMTQAGGAHPRVMAAGIARATLPTFAGMVLALSGLYFQALLRGWQRQAYQHWQHRLFCTGEAA